MSVKILMEKTEGIPLAKIDGDIDHHTAKEIREKIDDYITSRRPKAIYLDFQEVRFMDSSGIGLIMGRFKLIKSMGGQLKVVNVPRNLERMIKLSGLTKLGIF